MYTLDNKKEHCPISCIEDDNENASKIYGFSNALDKNDYNLAQITRWDQEVKVIILPTVLKFTHKR